jgi:hypothetical protein
VRAVSAVVALLAMALAPPGAVAVPGACPPHLFVIARSKNANIVAYDAKLETSGQLAEKPVAAYWLLDGDPTRREELNGVEWNRAYGFTIARGHESDSYSLTFRGGKRHITIRVRDGCPEAVGTIGGRTGVLRRLFVQSKEGLMPSVVYIELFGEDLETGQPLHEKFEPKK